MCSLAESDFRPWSATFLHLHNEQSKKIVAHVTVDAVTVVLNININLCSPV